MRNLRRSAAAAGNPAGRLARIAVVVVIASAAATAVWLGTGDQDTSTTAGSSASDTRADSQTDSESGVENGGSELVAPPDARSAPAEGVAVPVGSEQTGGYPTGFPYTDLGAVAVQVELAKAQIGFDYDQAAAVARLYADPADQAMFEDRSVDAVALRRQQAGVPVHGEVPAPASYAVTPVAYTLTGLGTDYYAVNLLSFITLTTAEAETRDGFYAGTQLVRWLDDVDGGADGQGNSGEADWKVVQGSSQDIQNLLEDGQPPTARPGTPAFDRAGWISINPTGDPSTTAAETADQAGRTS